MKQVFNDKIINIDKNLFDNKFLFEYLDLKDDDVEVVYLSDLLEQKINREVLTKVKDKPAMYSNVYSPEDELEIFKNLFNEAINNNKKIHIVGVTLKEEIIILEQYYNSLGFIREEINCFDPDFSIPLVTISVKIENLMWKGSDYKRMREKIFFNPPIRESGQVKAMFKGINRGVTAGIHISSFNQDVVDFLSLCVKDEKILPITMAKVLKYNLLNVGFKGNDKSLIIDY